MSMTFLPCHLEIDRVDIPGAGEIHLAGDDGVLGADAALLLGAELTLTPCFL